MAYEDRKKQRARKRKVGNIIIIGFFVLLLAKSAYGIIAKNPKTLLAKDEKYIVPLYAQSVIIKDESIYEIDGSLELNPGIYEGKKISKGYEIGKVKIVNDIHSLNEELKELDQAIDLLSKKNSSPELFSADKESLVDSQDELINQIQTKINEKNYSGIGQLKNQIQFNDDKLSDLSRDDTLLSQSLESLNSRRHIVISEINSNSINYYSQTAGVISFEIDGYENTYIPKEFENYSYERLQIPQLQDKAKDAKEVDKSIESYKIVDNSDWYLAVKIDNIQDMQPYKVGDSISLTIEDNDRELWGRIIAINEMNKNGVYLLQFNSYLYDYYNIRFPNVKIITKKEEAYLIPTKAIVDNKGQKGVYIKEFNGIVRFRPIEILGDKDDYTYISKGDSNRNINLDSSNPVKTISLYDEILINPWSFDEGEILY